MSSGLPPSQGYKVSGEGVPGGGPDATKQQGTVSISARERVYGEE